MSRRLPSHLSHHSVNVFSPPPERFDADVAQLLNSEDAVKYLTHGHSVHPSFAMGETPGEDNHAELTWAVEDVAKRRADQETEHEKGSSWYCVAAEDDQFAGICSLRAIDWYNRSCEMGICLLPDYWHRPIAAQTHFVVLQHAFEELLLHRISFCILSENNAMKSFLESAIGALHEGTLHDYYLDGTGTFHNAEMYSLTAPRWPDAKASLHRRIISAAETPRHHSHDHDTPDHPAAHHHHLIL
jgi:RimJ/RimL family protein N-acetyltransferase